jgi:hypothetical protein
MQDRYVGDMGDFAKYGLLRAIAGGKRLGVAWYLNSDAGPKGDGRHTSYLDQPRTWRPLDPELFDAMKTMVHGGIRSVEAVEESGVFGNAVFASHRLDIAALGVKRRGHCRKQWFEEVERRLCDCGLVFADPDNGFVGDERFKPGRKESTKSIPLFEANALALGRTAVIYHHNSRAKGGHIREIQEWMDEVPGCLLAWYWRRWSNRTFFVINPDREIEERLGDFARRWKKCGRLVHRTPGSPGSGSAGRSAGSAALQATNLPANRQTPMQSAELAPDPVVEAYKRHIDRTLLRQNLRRSISERVANLVALQRLAVEARRAGSRRKRAP